jgi:hypothetical protein
VPRQLLVRSPKADNKPTGLLFDTSIFDIRLDVPPPADIEVKSGLRLFTLHAALMSCAPGHFASSALDTRAALAMVSDGAFSGAGAGVRGFNLRTNIVCNLVHSKNTPLVQPPKPRTRHQRVQVHWENCDLRAT